MCVYVYVCVCVCVCACVCALDPCFSIKNACADHQRCKVRPFAYANLQNNSLFDCVTAMRLASLRTTAASDCESADECRTLPNTGCLYNPQKHILQCVNGCDETAIKQCQSMGDSFGCRQKVREEGGDGLPYKCVDVCAENLKLCDNVASLPKTECYADHTTLPTVAKCRDPCRDMSNAGQCESVGDQYACIPTVRAMNPDRKLFTCLNLCSVNRNTACVDERENTECYVDYTTLPSATKCRNPCLSTGKGSADEQCQSMGGRFVCRPKSTKEGGDGLPFKCVDACADFPTKCVDPNRRYVQAPTECYVDRAALPEVKLLCRNACTKEKNDMCWRQGRACKSTDTPPYFMCGYG